MDESTDQNDPVIQNTVYGATNGRKDSWFTSSVEGGSPVQRKPTSGAHVTSSRDRELSNSADFNSGIGNRSDEFVQLSYSGNGNAVEDSASKALKQCENYVVRPYNILLKVVGWRSIQAPGDRCYGCCKVFNWIYPGLIFVMLSLACVAQVFSCFSRTNSTPPTNVSEKYYVLNCTTNIVTLDVFPYVLKLLGYLYALYAFRVADPENLSNLANTVFLSFNDVMETRSRKRPLLMLMSIIIFGIGFFVMSAIFSLIRAAGFRLYWSNTIIAWFISNTTDADDSTEFLKIDHDSYVVIHYILWIFTYCGFLFFDLLYIAVFINYCSQCQLLTYLINNIIDKVRNKKYPDLYAAVKEIRKMDDYFSILNGNISIVVNLVMYTFLANVILSYVNMTRQEDKELNIVIGFLNLFQWVYISIVPILLATRATASGNELRRLGQEIAARPFYYSDTPDLELHFFLAFTESTRYQVNLAFIPMQPGLVYGFLFILLLFLSSGAVIPQVQSVTWF